jgi:hypothetical protein
VILGPLNPELAKWQELKPTPRLRKQKLTNAQKESPFTAALPAGIENRNVVDEDLFVSCATNFVVARESVGPYADAF